MEIKSVEQVFGYLSKQENYKKAIKSRISKIILGSSVIRAFNKETKNDVLKSLLRIDVSKLYEISSIRGYDLWHNQKTASVYKALLKKNAKKFKKDLEGLKWGHATKILNLFMGHLLLYSPYFDNAKYIKRVYGYLHVPIDSKVFALLRQCGVDTPKSIKSITKQDYNNIQEVLRTGASTHLIAPLLFDEYAWAKS